MEKKLAVTTAILAKDMAEAFSKHSPCTFSWQDCCGDLSYEWKLRLNTPEDNLGVTGSLQWLYENTKAPIIAFFHSDLLISEKGWDERVLREFEDPEVGVVGFGGAMKLGASDIYKAPYQLKQLARFDFYSNMDNWRDHGAWCKGSCQVATLDGFALIVRRELLRKWKQPFGGNPQDYSVGWPVKRYPFHNYDNALCIEAARQGFRVMLVGVKCHHYGGMTSTTPQAQDFWIKSLGKSDQEIHAESHLRLYEDGRGILPLRVKG